MANNAQTSHDVTLSLSIWTHTIDDHWSEKTGTLHTAFIWPIPVDWIKEIFAFETRALVNTVHFILFFVRIIRHCIPCIRNTGYIAMSFSIRLCMFQRVILHLRIHVCSVLSVILSSGSVWSIRNCCLLMRRAMMMYYRRDWQKCIRIYICCAWNTCLFKKI